ncbi:hypothetical protein CHLNCDRAFT_57487 [Chlorella variabilis]|uniref:Uncharacterized protein n=1 Tax=Chlorella variabilis TaxID=554065 RepID=E1ZC61_CHLVA|nr:hypothetical protein CHLNCDRAFT_57487 [Chlorella variabilis]EFN56555.1 hypothetical protein CHLNCDRAFT_57487 [Chlorella variabilis]|eukprot:XP_005848657.1 hypothetical protein CHLNCDRAFT_57487 [Chlorella variabilis]
MPGNLGLPSPRRRRAARFSESSGDLTAHQRRGRIDGQLLFLALAGACLLAVVSLNHGRQAQGFATCRCRAHARDMLRHMGHTVQSTTLQHQLQAARESSERRYTLQQTQTVVPGKRHRKLEHGLSLEEQQQALQAEEDEGWTDTDQLEEEGGPRVAEIGSGEEEEEAEALSLAAAAQDDDDEAAQVDVAAVAAAAAAAAAEGEEEGDGETGAAVQEAVGAGYNEEDEEDEEEEELEEEMQRQEAAAAMEEERLGALGQEGGAGAGEARPGAEATAEAAAAAAEEEGEAAAATAEEEGEAAADAGAGASASDVPRVKDAGGGSVGLVVEPKPHRKSPYQRALEQCKTLECVKQAARKKRFRGQFLFPHFFIIGWQAGLPLLAAPCAAACTASLFCLPVASGPWAPWPSASLCLPKSATTSLFHHLILHPRIKCPSEKTLHLDRMLRGDLRSATFEGSTHYAREGQRLAPGIAQTFPWAKLIASMREPISRAISMLAHNLDRRSIGCLTKRHVFHCLERDLPGQNYSEPFQAWLDAFPREQIMLLQYESLTAPEHVASHLRAVKSFLEVDPELPANELIKSNTREERLGKKPEGWPMKRHEYEKLVAMVRPDAERIAHVVTSYGFGDGRQWMRNWERAWQANLNSCNLQDDCVIQLT